MRGKPNKIGRAIRRPASPSNAGGSSEVPHALRRPCRRRLLTSGVRHNDMKSDSFVILIGVLAALGGAGGCREKSSAFPLSFATVEQIHSGGISFKERGGEIFVSVTDQSGDTHIHLLDYQGHSRQEALEILRRKQSELEKAAPSASAFSFAAQTFQSVLMFPLNVSNCYFPAEKGRTIIAEK
jgi:hypothetical protein